MAAAASGEISVEDAVEQLHQMFGDYDKAALAAVLEVRVCGGLHVLDIVLY